MNDMLSFTPWDRLTRWLVPLLLLIVLTLAGAAARAQSANGIQRPASGDSVAGVVVIEGTATDPSFLRYELAFRQTAVSGDWIVFAEADRPVIDGTLAVWDTTVGRQVNAPVFPDGPYNLRLRVVRTDYNYDEYTVTGIAVANTSPTPTPTAEATARPGISATLPAATAQGAGQSPAILPSLTPFPTPTAEAAPAGSVTSSGPPGPQDSGASGGILGQLAAIDYDAIGSAFWDGARVAVLIFAGMAAYLLLRWGVRRARRVISRRLNRAGRR